MPALLALTVPAVTLVLGVTVSMVMRPVFIVRYLVPCAPLIIFFVADGISSLKKETVFSGILAVMLTAFSGNLIFAVLDLLPQAGQFGSDALIHQAQAYVVQAESRSMVSPVLGYYETEVPIFSGGTLGDADPFPNIQDIEEFRPEDYRCFAVLTDLDSAPDASLLERFRAEKQGTYFVSYNSFDLWLLERIDE